MSKICFLLVLDPRYKDALFKNNTDIFDEIWVGECWESLAADLQRRNTAAPLPVSTPLAKSKSVAPSFFDEDDILGFVAASNPKVETVEQEMHCYLSGPRASTDTDPLAWWKVNQYIFPNLAGAAKDYLAIPGMYNHLPILSCLMVPQTFRFISDGGAYTEHWA